MQESFQRTADIWTTGIVNIPLNVPAVLIFSPETQQEADNITNLLKSFNISFSQTKTRKKLIIKTVNEVSVQGIKLIAHEMHIQSKNNSKTFPKMKRQTKMRYLYFELDTLEEDAINQVLEIYKFANLPVYYHRTMRGMHFLSIKPINENLWLFWLSKIKHLNPACPHVTLRIKPNKWVGEKDIWLQGWEYNPMNHGDTHKLKKIIENQDIPLLESKYFVVHYVQNGEAGNL